MKATSMSKFFVEIGAADFDTLLPLAKMGWSGYVVEPIPEMASRLEEMFDGYPVEIINAAVSDYNGSLEMVIARDDGSWLRGCSHVVSNNHLGFRLNEVPDRQGDFEQRITVPCFTLTRLLKDVQSVDFMKVDAEGHELNIFMNYDFRVKPKMIKVEHKHVSDEILRRKLETNGYLVYTEKDDIYGVS